MKRYHPNAEQLELADSLRRSLASILPLSRLRASYEESADAWKALHALGVFAISLAEEHGGGGLGTADEALIAIELGRLAATPSVIATLGAAHLRAALAPARRTGDLRVAAAHRRGDRIVFVEDEHATLLLVRSATGAALFERPNRSTLVDDTHWSSRLRDAAGLGAPLAEADQTQLRRLRLIDAAVLAGLAQAALEMAVAHAAVREQFGRPIGSFQAVQHHCANMALAARLASDQVSFAAVALDDRRADAALQVESALVVAADAAIANTGVNIQIHGGIGFSDEADPHRLLKRARVVVDFAGGREAALARVAEVPLGDAHGAQA